MIARDAPLLSELEAGLAARETRTLETLVASRAIRDHELAELIEVDARWRLDAGLPVTLERYLAIVPDLPDRPVSLDAAVEFALRALSGSSRPTPDAVRALSLAHPELGLCIRNAAALSQGLATTRTLRRLDAGMRQRPLPCEFGPRMRDGRIRYELVERLGGGSQGEVYRAVDRLLSEPERPAFAAVKVLADSPWSDADRWRVIDEATRARRIDHPNVVRVLDRGAGDDHEDYVVYEYIQGGDLDRWLRDKPRDAREIARLIALTARGVQAAHSAGLVHRDLKPGNILLSAAGDPKVADFGIAAAAEHGQFPADTNDQRGNLAFIAPEQFRGEESAAGPAVDIYALGGILYFALTGRMPNGETAEEVAQTHALEGGRTAAPEVSSRLPGFDADLGAICRRALAPRPQDRHPSAEALGNDLDAWLRREPLPWRRPSLLRRTSLLVRREPRLVLAVVAGAIVLAAGVAVSTYVWARGRAQTELAQAQAAASKARADTEESWRMLFSKVMPEIRKRVENQQDDWFVATTILESVTGPYFFDPHETSMDVWTRRSGVATAIVVDNTLKGQGTSIETLLWCDTAAYWHLRVHNIWAAERLLARGDKGWEDKLDANDHWRAIRAGLKAICTVQKRMKLDKPTDSAEPTDAELLAAEKTLRGLEADMSAGPQDDALHRFVLHTLADLYGPKLLNQPENLRWVDERALDVREAAYTSNPPRSYEIGLLLEGDVDGLARMPAKQPKPAKKDSKQP